MRRKWREPYDVAAYEAIAKELIEGPPLVYADALTQDRVAKAVARAAGDGGSNALIASRLNKHGVPDARGRTGKWDWAEVISAKERATKLAAEAYANANPRKLPTAAELQKQHAEFDAAGTVPEWIDPPSVAGHPLESMTMRQMRKLGF